MNLFSAIDKLRGDIHSGDGWRILCGDCLELLWQLPDKSADLIFADPPYNLQLKGELYRPNMTRVNGVSDSWDQFNSFSDYDSFCETWLRGCRRVLKPDGAIWVIGTYHNIYRLARLLQDLGFWLMNDCAIIWEKTNPIPNFQGKRFTNATETLLWAKRDKKGRAKLNYKLMKRENGGKQMPNVWRLPICNGQERLRSPGGVKSHPTQKPEELMRRVLLATTSPGDTVLDPFLGSGTTLAVARRLGRVGVGIDSSAKYAALAHRRISQIKRDKNIPAEPTLPVRVSMKELIQANLLKKGRTLYFGRKGEIRATLLQSGKIRMKAPPHREGSIHQMGALAAGADQCNGWVHWHVKESGSFVCIDEVRTQQRNSLGKGD